MTKEEAIEFLTEISYALGNMSVEYLSEKDGEKMRDAIKVLEQEPCDDCISREAVNDLVDELARAISDERCYMSRGRSTGKIMQDILDLPSVTPKKTGKWETTTTTFCGRTFEVIECSCCKEKQDWYAKTNFCPNCGAKMVNE